MNVRYRPAVGEITNSRVSRRGKERSTATDSKMKVRKTLDTTLKKHPGAKLRLLHILSSVDPKFGGPIEGVAQSGKVFTKNGHTVEVVSLDDADQTFVKSFPLTLYALGPSLGVYGYNSRLVPWLKSNAYNYDAVVINGIWQYNCFGAWRALRTADVPYYVCTHGMLDPWFKHTYPLKHFKKWLYWPWGVYPVLRDAQAVLFTSEEERRLARQSFWLYRAREKVIKYGASAPTRDEGRLREHFITIYPELRGRRILLYLSRIHEKKGCDLLVSAFARVIELEPELHLIIAGPGETQLVSNLKALALKLGVANRITWTGMLMGTMKSAAFHCGEAFILPSHQENFGIAVTEALSYGLPVLISDKVNIWREIEAEGAGFVASDTLQGTEDNLRNWLSLNADNRAMMTARASAAYLKYFTIEAMCASLLEVILPRTRRMEVAKRQGL